MKTLRQQHLTFVFNISMSHGVASTIDARAPAPNTVRVQLSGGLMCGDGACGREGNVYLFTAEFNPVTA